MAFDFGSSDSGTFYTGNMKPESGDQVDALWGQNIADNMAYLRWNGTHNVEIINNCSFTRSHTYNEGSSNTHYDCDIWLRGTEGTLFGTIVGDFLNNTYSTVTAALVTLLIPRSDGTIFTTNVPNDTLEQGFEFPLGSTYSVGSVYPIRLHINYIASMGANADRLSTFTVNKYSVMWRPR